MAYISPKASVENARNRRAVADPSGHWLADWGSYMIHTRDFIAGSAKVMIGRYCSIGQGIFCVGSDHDYRRVTTSPFWIHYSGEWDCGWRIRPRRNHILIGNDVWIGDGARIMGGVHINNGAVIGAGAVVAKDVPPYAVVAGNPAKVIKYRFSQDIIDKLQRIKYWYWPYEEFLKNIPMMYNVEEFVEKYDPGVKMDESSLAKMIQKERSQGKKICVFLSDYGEKDSLLDKVLEQYAKYAPAECLLMVVSNSGGDGGELNHIKGCLQICDSGKGVLYAKKLTPAVWQNTDYYIAGINYGTMMCLDYVSDFGAKILSALDEDIFYWCGGGRNYIEERVAAAQKALAAIKA
ncbi:MAG: CatB-related O-acetyltransferase [Selenomonas ruminantium]|nr:CatB-related O-acetyltransferase [Selenomonas ruminantium]